MLAEFVGLARLGYDEFAVIKKSRLALAREVCAPRNVQLLKMEIRFEESVPSPAPQPRLATGS